MEPWRSARAFCGPPFRGPPLQPCSTRVFTPSGAASPPRPPFSLPQTRCRPFHQTLPRSNFSPHRFWFFQGPVLSLSGLHIPNAPLSSFASRKLAHFGSEWINGCYPDSCISAGRLVQKRCFVNFCFNLHIC